MELDDNSLLSYCQYNRAPSFNLQNKHQKEEKEIEAWKEYSRWEIAFEFEAQRKQTEKARCRQRGSTELAMSETQSHEDIVKEEYTDKISSPVLLRCKGSSLV